MTSFLEYQVLAHETAIYPTVVVQKEDPLSEETVSSTSPYPIAIITTEEVSWVYPVMGLANEAGEVLGKAKKLIRDKHGAGSKEDIDEISKELGDVLWYLAETATAFGLDLAQIAEANISKLKSRQVRNVIGGKGDNR